MILFRPVGQAEYELIVASEFRRFPPRLEFQPIFYPVCNLQYAEKIAMDWNTRDAASGFVGYVLRFEVEDAFISRYERQVVGDSTCEEYWIPAEELDSFNDSIIGFIEVVNEFRGLV